MWLINLNGHLLECMGLILMGTKGYYRMSYLACAIGGTFLGVWEETLMLCCFPMNIWALSFLPRLCISSQILFPNMV